MIILDGKTKLGAPASNKDPYVPSFIYKLFFFLKITLTIVEPLSATIALPGSQIISGKEASLRFPSSFLISLI